MRFLWDNYADTEILANYEVSSEKAAFPVENAFNLNRRSKVWRSNGYFMVESSNNTIIFRDSVGGPDLTATIAVGEYNDTASFMAAVDAAIEAVGANNYTVTQNSNFRFVIASDGVAFELRTANVLFTAASMLGFDTATHRTGAVTYTADFLRVNSGLEFVLFDMGISSNPNAIALTGPRNTPLKFGPGVTLRLRGNPTDPVDWSTAAFSADLTFDDETIVKFSTTDVGFGTVSYRYWRLEIVDQNPNGFTELGAIFLGRYFEPTKCPQFPFNSNFIDSSKTVTSEGGQSFSDILPHSQGYDVKYKNLVKEDIESIRNYFEIYGTALPFFICYDEQEVFTSSLSRSTVFVRFDANPSYSYASPLYFDCSMSFKEEL